VVTEKRRGNKQGADKGETLAVSATDTADKFCNRQKTSSKMYEQVGKTVQKRKEENENTRGKKVFPGFMCRQVIKSKLITAR